MGCHFHLQKIFPAQGLNPGLPYCKQTLYRLSHQGMKDKSKTQTHAKSLPDTRDLSEDFGEGRGQQARQQRKGHWKRDHPLSLPTLHPPGGCSLTHPWSHIRCLDFSPFLAPSSLGTKSTNLVPCFLSSGSSTLNPSVPADTLTHSPGEPYQKATSGHLLPCQGCWGPLLP